VKSLPRTSCWDRRGIHSANIKSKFKTNGGRLAYLEARGSLETIFWSFSLDLSMTTPLLACS
ncbi:MAG: hypothetical protein ACRECH_11070, partial [Nitrososphaerales archaeon]